MLRCAELHLGKDDLDNMTIGMIIDMLIERMNDYEKSDENVAIRAATQQDFDKF